MSDDESFHLQDPVDEVCTKSEKLGLDSDNESGAESGDVIYKVTAENIPEGENIQLDLDDPILNKVNLPERILFIIDASRESGCTPFELGSGDKFSPFQMIKRIVQVFIQAKMSINNYHKYTFMILKDKADFSCNFSNNLKDLLNTLERFSEVTLDDSVKEFDLSECFDLISTFLDPEPNYITRAILIYSRSNVLPIMSDKFPLNRLFESPLFFLDAIYIHEPVNDDNLCEVIYSELTKLDLKNNSYILEVGRNATKLHNTMAQLLAHPLIRPKQNDADYNIFIKNYNSDNPITI